MAMSLEVARAAIEAMHAEAARRHPREACGLLFGAGRIERAVACANVHSDPLRLFEIDPAALIAAHKASRAGGPTLAGYWHSHPLGPPEPSAIDRAMAAGDGRVWAIVGQGAVRFWRDSPGGFEPLSTACADV